MTGPALHELLAPPTAAEGLPAQRGLEAMAEALLERFRQEDRVTRAAGLATVAAQDLPAQAEEALYAWGVLCYGQGRYDEASALFGAALRRRTPSARLVKALGAARLALHDAVGAAEAFARAAQLDPADAELHFHWAQAEKLQSRRDEARRLLGTARALAPTHASRWPDLLSWCDELMRHLDPSTPPAH